MPVEFLSSFFQIWLYLVTTEALKLMHSCVLPNGYVHILYTWNLISQIRRMIAPWITHLRYVFLFPDEKCMCNYDLKKNITIIARHFRLSRVFKLSVICQILFAMIIKPIAILLFLALYSRDRKPSYRVPEPCF